MNESARKAFLLDLFDFMAIPDTLSRAELVKANERLADERVCRRVGMRETEDKHEPDITGSDGEGI